MFIIFFYIFVFSITVCTVAFFRVSLLSCYPSYYFLLNKFRFLIKLLHHLDLVNRPNLVNWTSGQFVSCGELFVPQGQLLAPLVLPGENGSASYDRIFRLSCNVRNEFKGPAPPPHGPTLKLNGQTQWRKYIYTQMHTRPPPIKARALLIISKNNNKLVPVTNKT